MIRVVGIGAGGHARVVLDILRQDSTVTVIGLVDNDRDRWGETLDGIPVLGGDDQLPALRHQGVTHAFIGVGSASDLRPRRRAWQRTVAEGFEMVSAIHPRACIAASVVMGRGVTIMAGAILNPGARLGENVIVNTGAIVDHDCELSDHVHVATGARLAGTVIVGEAAHIGIGATIRQGIRIGREAVIAAGAVVVDDVDEAMIVAGVPARVLRGVSRT
jgi:sugar O-acyltransferase (sialic acid O-acetyltransferase NeuD family)